LLGLRESFGDVVFDPVLPHRLDGLVADVRLLGLPVQLIYSVRSGTSAPSAIRVNGSLLTDVRRDANPYRPGGLRVDGAALAASLTAQQNRIEIDL
jgi:CRISPR-associated protein Csx3